MMGQIEGSTRKAGVARRRWHDLGARALSGLVLVALALGSVEAGGTAFLLVWLIAAMAMLWEWQRLCAGALLFPRLVVGFGALAAVAALARTDLWDGGLVILGACVVSALLAGSGRRVWAAGGLAYASCFLMAVLALRFSFPFGRRAILWLFAVVWSTDVFAYFGGRLFGGPKLWPRVSPSKTWSGTLSGIMAGAALGTTVALRDAQATASIWPVLMLSIAASALSQGGDAFESAVKRRFGVKDSSRLIPGHGGVLDRLDGFVAATIFAFLFGLLRNLPSIAGGLFYWA